MKHKFLLLYTWLVRTLMFFFPDIPMIMRLRGFLYGLGMISCGRDFQVAHDVNIKALECIEVGNHCFIGNNVLLLGSGGTYISDEVLIGPNTIIISGKHSYCNGSFRFGKPSDKTRDKIVLSFGSWVGGNCTVFAGAHLPQGSVLSANSLLNKQFEITNSIYGGVPAKFIKTL